MLPESQWDVNPMTARAASLEAGTPGWIAVTWEAIGADAEDFRVTVQPPQGITASYPANTVDHSGPWADYTLTEGEIDYTAFKLAVPDGYAGDQRVKLTVKYLQGGKKKTKIVHVEVPVQPYEGELFVVETTSLGEVPVGESTWVGVTLSGLAPIVNGISVSVADAAGLQIGYPGDGGATSLTRDADLDRGESDTAGFRIDAYDVDPGDYALMVIISYVRAGAPGSMTVPLSVTVTG